MLSFKKSFRTGLLAAGLSFAGLGVSAQNIVQPKIIQESWTKDYPPFRIAGNLYYVGTEDLSSYLIVTPKGDILINTGLADSGPMIKRHIEKLGFKISDIKILMATHAHFDHVGAMAALKKMTGAQVYIHAADARVLADGGFSDYAFGGKNSTFAPLPADHLLHNNDVVKLGGTNITVLHHPGHTKGACSFLFDVRDQNRSYRVLIANMPSVLDEARFPGMPNYPYIGKDYDYTFGAMRKVQFDIWLASHASQFNMEKKHKPGDAYNPAAFMNDRKGYDAELDDLYQAYQKRRNNKKS